MQKSRYATLGIDARKSAIRQAITGKVYNEYPGAFVNIATDPDFPEYIFTLHMDGDGSKIVQRLLQYALTDDISVIAGAVDDALQMNYVDIASAGFVDGLLVLADVIDIYNQTGFVPKPEIVEQLVERFVELIILHENYGFDKQYFMGGETADLPDQVKSMVCNVATFARTKKTNVIKGNVQDGDAIYGFASDGRAHWETEHLFGLGSNGYTQARTDLMHRDYNTLFPHLYGKNKYEGNFYYHETPKLLQGATVSEALTSPTRQYSILIRTLIDTLKRHGIFEQLHGIVANTGGGATKIEHIGTGGFTYEKEMPLPPPIFKLIQQEPQPTLWKDMFETFNCGVGIDVIGEDTPEFKAALKETERETGVQLYTLGSCRTNGMEQNKVVLHTPHGSFEY